MKKTALIVFKVLVTAGLFWYVFSKIDTAKLWMQIKQANIGCLSLAFTVNFLTIFLGAWRWEILLATQGIPARFYPVYWATCAGNFFNSLLPGLTGGDLARVYYAAQMAPSKKVGAGVSVAVDRIVGMLGLMLLAGIVVILFGHKIWNNDIARRAMIAVLITVIFFFGCSLAFVRQKTVSRWVGFENWLPRLPFQKMVSHLREINAAYHEDKGALGNTVLISVAIHVLSILVVCLIGRSLGLAQVSMTAYYIVMPIINAVSAIPVSINGLGVRETMSVTMMGAIGIPPEAAVALSLIYFGVIVLTSLAAGLFYMFAKPATMHQEKISDIISNP